VGLAIGLSCFLLIALYVTDELNFDRYNDKADRIYRINSDISFGGRSSPGSHLGYDGAIIKEGLSRGRGLHPYLHVQWQQAGKKDNEFIKEAAVANVDSTFLNVFTLPAIKVIRRRP